MDKSLCSSCIEKANYHCECKTPPILLCSTHLVPHLAGPGDHKITKLADNGKTISNNALKLAIDHLSALEREIDIRIQELTQKSQEIIKSINEQFMNAISKFIKLQTHYKTLISSLRKDQKIIDKEFYPPFEAALIEERVQEFFSNVKHPSIKFRNYSKLIVYNDTNFFHIEKNYCNYSLFISEDSTIKIYPVNKVIQSNISAESSCLQVSSTSFLLTGGIRQMRKCFILELPSTLIEHSTLLTNRSYHSMCWINGSPAVIGGQLNNDTLNTIEVLVNKKWTEFPPMIHKRLYPSCITHNNVVWVQGGCYDLKVLDSIEYFMDSTWKECKIKLTEPIRNFFMYSCMNGIKIIGGIDSKNKYSTNRYIFDDEGKMVFEDKMKENIASALQMWCATAKGWAGFNMNGDIVEFIG